MQSVRNTCLVFVIGAIYSLHAYHAVYDRVLACNVEEPVFHDRSYYDSLVEKALLRRWLFSVTSSYFSENRAFNNRGAHVPLSAILFGKCPIAVKDIYLFSWLSDENKVRIDNSDARNPERLNVPVGGTGVVFGGFRDDLYSTLLAPIELRFDAYKREIHTAVSGMLRHELRQWQRCTVSFGFTIPIKSVYHRLDMIFVGGGLLRKEFVPNGETSLEQFFRDFSDVEDFVNREILESKGLTFINKQFKVGFGDASLFSQFEYRNDHNFEVGLNVLFPTAGRSGTDKLWEPALGNGGAYICNPFAQLLMSTATQYCNPVIRAAVEISLPFHAQVRVPRFVVNDERKQVKLLQDLSAPESFQDFYVDAFCRPDSTIPFFADTVACLKKRIGTALLFGVGNYIHDLFHSNLRLGIFYDFFVKAQDSFHERCSKTDCSCTTRSTLNLASLESCTSQRAHTIGVSLAYKFNNWWEILGGGQAMIAGRNIPQTRSLFISFVAVF